MALTTLDQLTASTAYAGPLDNDPLTEHELAVLLAIPRGAEKTPNATMFRFPLGPEPTHGRVDVTFAEARSIVARLAAEWKAKLSNVTGLNVGPGTTICLLVQPIAHVMLHWLAFWALGCSIQVISLSMDDDAIALYLNKSGCHVVVHSGINDARVERIYSAWDGTMVRLAEEEHAHQLALSEKQKQVDSVLPWPQVQRPDPAMILHSSGSTGLAKLLHFSLHFSTPGLPSFQTIAGGESNMSPPDPRPFLIFSPPYWQSFNASLSSRLITGTPIAFPHVLDLAKVPSGEFMDWVQSLDAGGSMCAPRFIRDVLASGSESSISFLQGMNTLAVSGSALDESTAALVEKYKLKLINVFGCTELGALLLTHQAPHTHLHHLPGNSLSPLVHPISDPDPDGSRQVQFWFSPLTSPRIAHIHTKGGVPFKFEPFPGEGPHNGEPAIKLDDIFKEIQTGSQVSYVYLGRSDDLIKLAGRGGWDVNASTYETELASTVTLYLAKTGRWTVEGVQLFGNDRPCTALVVQLCPASGEQGEIGLGRDIIDHISSLVELVNGKLDLEPYCRVNPRKRMLIVTSAGEAYGPGVGDFGEAVPRLIVTHKHTLQRWKNVEAFGNWLGGLDYSEP